MNELKIFKKRTLLLSNRWHWRIKSGNGKIVARSTEGFYSKFNAEENARLTYESLKNYFEK